MTLKNLPLNQSFKCSIELEQNMLLIDYDNEWDIFVGYTELGLEIIDNLNLKIIKIHDDKGFRGKYRS